MSDRISEQHDTSTGAPRSDRPDRKKQRPKGVGVTLKVLSIIGKVLLSALLIMVITGSIVAGAMTIYIMKMDKGTDIDLGQMNLNYTSFLYEKDDVTGEWVKTEEYHGQENRTWVDFDQIPQYMKDAAVAIEDQRFYQHKGVDWKRTIGAMINSFVPIYGGRQGGSTITQQLIKNLTDDTDVSFSRKIREIMRALEFEKTNNKDDILCAYLNTIALGSGCHGVQAAANKYFGKDVSQLNLAECASIIGITKYPTRYNPLLYPENNKERQLTVLAEMLRQGKISQAEYDEAVAYPLEFNPSSTLEEDVTHVQSWYSDMVFEDVVDSLVEELGYDRKYAQTMLFTQGLRIYSAVDRDAQAAVEEVYSDPSNFPSIKAASEPQSGIVVMDYTGRIVATAGAIGEKTDTRVFSRATMAKRQTGSSIKPLTTYGPALEFDKITYSTVYPDEPLTIKQNGKLTKWPPNYNDRWSYENVTVQKGLEKSLNTISARILEDIGIDASFDFAKDRFHLDSLIDSEEINGITYTDRDRSPLALGGMTKGLTVLEMTAAFQTFGNGGLYYEPYSFYRVEDADGNVLIEKAKEGEGSSASRTLSSDTAYIMNRLMTQVVDGSSGTGREIRNNGYWPESKGMEIFAKTGTSGADNDSTNVWIVGGTPYYVAGVWYGFDTPKALPKSIVNGAKYGWAKSMRGIHADLENIKFPADDSVVMRTYCEDSGLLAGNSCTHKKLGYYKKTNIPGVCNGIHKNLSDGALNDESSELASSTPAVSQPESSSQEVSSSSPAVSEAPSSQASESQSSIEPPASSSSSTSSQPVDSGSSSTHRPAA